ncbi:MAG: alpha-ketoacid dehydrogenase subunit beta, partial [Pseudomonadota bacterium]
MTQTNERKLTIARAMAEAVAQEMRTDERVFVMGEDIAALGGVYGNTRGLLEEFGEERIRDTPISETGFIGAAVGAAQDGMRPVVELMFVDFFGVCFDAIYNLMAKNIYFSGGNFKVPMVLMTSTGGGYSDAGQHSQCLYGSFAHLPGMKVVAPSNAYDAK